MTGRRAIVGLSLLCALAFSAFGAASASAKGTTALTCAPVTPDAKTAGFSDAHCTKDVTGSASFEHFAINPGETTAITVTNKETAEETKGHTPSTLSGTAGGAKIEIKCTNVTGSGWLENRTTLGVMGTFGTAELEYTTCEVLKVKNCTVAEPIKAQVLSESKVVGEEMWIEFSQDGALFAPITFKGGSCALNGVTLEVTGSVKGTTNGATISTSPGEDNLFFGPNAADLTSTMTLRMSGAGGNPVTMTTTEP